MSGPRTRSKGEAELSLQDAPEGVVKKMKNQAPAQHQRKQSAPRGVATGNTKNAGVESVGRIVAKHGAEEREKSKQIPVRAPPLSRDQSQDRQAGSHLEESSGGNDSNTGHTANVPQREPGSESITAANAPNPGPRSEGNTCEKLAATQPPKVTSATEIKAKHTLRKGVLPNLNHLNEEDLEEDEVQHLLCNDFTIKAVFEKLEEGAFEAEYESEGQFYKIAAKPLASFFGKYCPQICMEEASSKAMHNGRAIRMEDIMTNMTERLGWSEEDLTRRLKREKVCVSFEGKESKSATGISDQPRKGMCVRCSVNEGANTTHECHHKICATCWQDVVGEDFRDKEFCGLEDRVCLLAESTSKISNPSKRVNASEAIEIHEDLNTIIVIDQEEKGQSESIAPASMRPKAGDFFQDRDDAAPPHNDDDSGKSTLSDLAPCQLRMSAPRTAPVSKLKMDCTPRKLLGTSMENAETKHCDQRAIERQAKSMVNQETLKSDLRFTTAWKGDPAKIKANCAPAHVVLDPKIQVLQNFKCRFSDNPLHNQEALKTLTMKKWLRDLAKAHPILRMQLDAHDKLGKPETRAVSKKIYDAVFKLDDTISNDKVTVEAVMANWVVIVIASLEVNYAELTRHIRQVLDNSHYSSFESMNFLLDQFSAKFLVQQNDESKAWKELLEQWIATPFPDHPHAVQNRWDDMEKIVAVLAGMGVKVASEELAGPFLKSIKESKDVNSKFSEWLQDNKHVLYPHPMNGKFEESVNFEEVAQSLLEHEMRVNRIQNSDPLGNAGFQGANAKNHHPAGGCTKGGARTMFAGNVQEDQGLSNWNPGNTSLWPKSLKELMALKKDQRTKLQECQKKVGWRWFWTGDAVTKEVICQKCKSFHGSLVKCGDKKLENKRVKHVAKKQNKNTESGVSFTGTCFNCDSVGHRASDCTAPKKAKGVFFKKKQPNHVGFASVTEQEDEQEDGFFDQANFLASVRPEFQRGDPPQTAVLWLAVDTSPDEKEDDGFFDQANFLESVRPLSQRGDQPQTVAFWLSPASSPTAIWRVQTSSVLDKVEDNDSFEANFLASVRPESHGGDETAIWRVQTSSELDKVEDNVSFEKNAAGVEFPIPDIQPFKTRTIVDVQDRGRSRTQDNVWESVITPPAATVVTLIIEEEASECSTKLDQDQDLSDFDPADWASGEKEEDSLQPPGIFVVASDLEDHSIPVNQGAYFNRTNGPIEPMYISGI